MRTFYIYVKQTVDGYNYHITARSVNIPPKGHSYIATANADTIKEAIKQQFPNLRNLI